MSNWRRQKPRNNHHQRGTTTMTQSSKPPLGNCKPSVPAWEKDFCAVVGSIPWWKVLEAKRDRYLYDSVVQWDDSAGEDAFKNAKSRFWAEINGFPCDLSLPDPDIYIDDVDWDAQVDSELILDLERGPDPVKEEDEEHVVILDSLALSAQYSGLVWGTGWGDAEGINEGIPENSWDVKHCDGWNEDSWGVEEKTESWDHKKKKNNNGFKTESWDRNNNNNNGFRIESWDRKNSYNHNKVENWNGGDQGRESGQWRKRGEVPRGGDRVEDCRWRNGRGRSRGGFQQYSNGWGWTESF